MKKLLVIVLFFIIFSVPVITDAKMMKDKEGNVVETDDSLVELSIWERKAVANEGVEVPIISSVKYKRTSLFYYTPIEEYNEVVVYDGGFITIEKSGEIPGEEKIAVFVVVLIVASIFLAISNLLVCKKMYSCAVIVTSAVAAIFIATGVDVVESASASISSFLVTVTGAVAVTITVVVTGADMTKTKMRIYKIASIVSYVFVIIVILNLI